MSYIIDNPALVGELLLQHLQMTVGALLAALAVALPLGIVTAQHRRLAGPVLATLGALYTVPSLALIILLIPFFGLNATSVMVALVLYAQVILVRTIVAALEAIQPAVLEAARGMGMNPWRTWWQVQLPLALPVIVAGVRVAAITVIGIAAIGAKVGAGGLGRLLFDGIAQAGREDKIWAGALALAALAFGVNGVLLVIERACDPRLHIRRAEPAPAGATFRGWWLVLARLAWCGLVALALGVFGATIPARFGQLTAIATMNHSVLLQLGLTDEFLVVYVMALDLVVIVAYALTAAMIFWRRSDDRAALYASLVLMIVGAMLTRPDDAVRFVEPALRLPIILVFALATISIVIFLYVFPDGRFVPRWTRWLAGIWGGGVLAWYLWPVLLTRQVPWPPATVPIPFVLLALSSGLLAQIHRYRHISSPAQRQQTKWVVLGLAAAIQGVLWFLLLVPVLIPAIRQPGLTRVSYILIGVPLFYLTMLLLPFAIGLSILRYRLWNIDAIINRALVYGLLTGLLLAVYFGSVVLLQGLFRGVTGQGSELAIIISTLAGIALFQPLRGRLQAFIDRRFYRRKYDGARALAAFNTRLRDEVDLTTITDDLIGVVQETVQPSSVSLWLCQPVPKRES